MRRALYWEYRSVIRLVTFATEIIMDWVKIMEYIMLRNILIMLRNKDYTSVIDLVTFTTEFIVDWVMLRNK